MNMMERFKTFYLFAKAFLVSFLLFAGIQEVKQHGWTRQAWGNFAIAGFFTCSTFLILHLARKRGVIE